jgi:hypothetical protein
LTTLVMLGFGPCGQLLAHRMYHWGSPALYSAYGFQTKLAFFLANRLGSVGVLLGSFGALAIGRKPAAGLAAVLAQLVAFLGVLAVLAFGFLSPFEPMCGEDWDPFTLREVWR